MALSDILTNDILDSYAKACCDMGMDLWTLAMDGKHGHLLMPSRGAFPILWHATTSFQRILKKHHGNDTLAYLKEKFSIPHFNEIWLPFTAYAPDDKVNSAQQRKHWCLVLKGILDGVDNPSLIIHRTFTQDICNQRFDHTTTDLNRPKGLVIIDTVISGRAVTEIASALDEVGIEEYVFLLAVDENGDKMRDPFKNQIRDLEEKGKAKLYRMEKIFTEDSHPGLTGVTAVVFPQITALLNKERSCGATVGFWHIEVSKRPDGMNLPFTMTAAVTQNALFRRICTLIDGDGGMPYKFEDASYDKEHLQEQEENGSEDPDLTRKFILPVVKKGELANTPLEIQVTSSYIASALLDEAFAQTIANKCLLSMTSSHVQK